MERRPDGTPSRNVRNRQSRPGQRTGRAAGQGTSAPWRASDLYERLCRREYGSLAAVYLAPVMVLTGVLLEGARTAGGAEPDASRAFGYLEAVCEFGPRMSGSLGMEKQQQLLEQHFSELGAEVRYQEFDVAHPETGRPVRLKNMIVSWHPQTDRRILLCCHYDTRPRPDRELLPINWNKPFIGANDGGSGVALFMELGHFMKDLPVSYGVDFVFFDAEEFVFDRSDDYFLGSEHFARQYRDNPPRHRYVAGVLVDMIADKQLSLYYEHNSLSYAPDLTRSIWDTAERLKVSEFIPRRKHNVRDDHLPLNEIAKIPTCDIIDFDFRYWHTRNDLPAVCSGTSLAKVGRVLLEWLQTYR